MEYIVATVTLVGESMGARTWTTHRSKDDFDNWWKRVEPKGWYRIAHQGITVEEAIFFCRYGFLNEAEFQADLRKRDDLYLEMLRQEEKA
jgi:hypothetical protein